MVNKIWLIKKIIKYLFNLLSKAVSKPEVFRATTLLSLLMIIISITYGYQFIYRASLERTKNILHSTIDIRKWIIQDLSILHNRYCKDNTCYIIGIHLNPHTKHMTVYTTWMTLRINKTKVEHYDINIDLTSLGDSICDEANCNGIQLTKEDYLWLINTYTVGMINMASPDELKRHISFNRVLSRLTDKRINNYIFVPYKDLIHNDPYWYLALATTTDFNKKPSDVLAIEENIVQYTALTGQRFSNLL
jgi:hypothetical protein